MGEGYERGFCVNLACPESPLSGWQGPAQIIAECFVRFGIPWKPCFHPYLPLRDHPPPPQERRITRRQFERSARFAPRREPEEAEQPAQGLALEGAQEDRSAGAAAEQPEESAARGAEPPRRLAPAPKAPPPAPPSDEAPAADGSAEPITEAAAPVRTAGAAVGAPVAQPAGGTPGAAPSTAAGGSVVPALAELAGALAQPQGGRRQSAATPDEQAEREGAEAQLYTSAELFMLVEKLGQLGVSRGGVASPRAAASAPDPQLPTRLPPIGVAEIPQLVARGDRLSPRDCWAAARAGDLHLSSALADPLDELFCPPGHAPRDVGSVMRWIEAEEYEAAEELEASFQEFRTLSERLKSATLRARNAVTRSAWLYAARAKASARDIQYLR